MPPILFQILFEDEFILAIDKPSGLPSHAQKNSTHASSVETELKKLREPIFLLHRLDTGTSGVLLFAKSEAVYQQMREQFKQKKIKKFYRAWSNCTLSDFPALPLEIKTPLAHHPKSEKRMIALLPGKKQSHRGQPLPAHSRIHAACASSWMNQPATEFQVEIITGVMHQIRVHLKSLGFPLWGDPIYNAPATASRLGLHAERIEFEFQGYLYQIEAPLTIE